MFFLGLLITIEITLRVTHMTIDLPRRVITDRGVQRYAPNQDGYWLGGGHKWYINSMGWPGSLPASFDNLILLVGDSHLENFMNPGDCHQNILLKANLSGFNFFEAGRSGVSFIEGLEISSELDTINPILSLLYVKDEDFTESIADLGRLNDITQVDLSNSTLIHGQLKHPLAKNILYSVKIAYYYFNKLREVKFPNQEIKNCSESLIDNHKLIKELLIFGRKEYNIEKVVLVFHPGSDKGIVSLSREVGYKTITFDPGYEMDWGSSPEDTGHWSCNGHREAARIISDSLTVMFNSDKIKCIQ